VTTDAQVVLGWLATGALGCWLLIQAVRCAVLIGRLLWVLFEPVILVWAVLAIALIQACRRHGRAGDQR
jgi:hypothetical protein